MIASPDQARARLTEALVRTGQEDREAFRSLYRLTSAKLFGVILRICPDRGVAEELLHDVYLLVWRRAGAFDPGRASPITWLATVARNRAIDWRRAQGDRQFIDVDAVAELPDATPLASDALVDADERDRLHRCLQTLEPRQRSAIRTAFFDGVTYAELAGRAGVPLGTMKSWVRRGLIGLRQCLEA